MDKCLSLKNWPKWHNWLNTGPCTVSILWQRVLHLNLFKYFATINIKTYILSTSLRYVTWGRVTELLHVLTAINLDFSNKTYLLEYLNYLYHFKTTKQSKRNICHASSTETWSKRHSLPGSLFFLNHKYYDASKCHPLNIQPLYVLVVLQIEASI